MNKEVNFFTEDIEFNLAHSAILTEWLLMLAEQHGFEVDTLNYIFCSDEYLLQINQTYLDHDYYTDIITFNHSEEEDVLLSDIYISIDRVKDNASEMNISFENELHRVIVHGFIHLLGYSDKTDSEKETMRQKEDTCLSLLKI